jgi:hypothetical protein
MTFRIRGRYPATASLCKTWATNVAFAAPVSGPTSPESHATPLSLSLTPASIADTRALLSLDEKRWPQREQRLAMRSKGDSSAGSVCNFLASTRAATVSRSARRGTPHRMSEMRAR